MARERDDDIEESVIIRFKEESESELRPGDMFFVDHHPQRKLQIRGIEADVDEDEGVEYERMDRHGLIKRVVRAMNNKAGEEWEYLNLHTQFVPVTEHIFAKDSARKGMVLFSEKTETIHAQQIVRVWFRFDPQNVDSDEKDDAEMLETRDPPDDLEYGDVFFEEFKADQTETGGFNDIDPIMKRVNRYTKQEFEDREFVSIQSTFTPVRDNSSYFKTGSSGPDQGIVITKGEFVQTIRVWFRYLGKSDAENCKAAYCVPHANTYVDYLPKRLEKSLFGSTKYETMGQVMKRVNKMLKEHKHVNGEFESMQTVYVPVGKKHGSSTKKSYPLNSRAGYLRCGKSNSDIQFLQIIRVWFDSNAKAPGCDPESQDGDE